MSDSEAAPVEELEVEQVEETEEVIEESAEQPDTGESEDEEKPSKDWVAEAEKWKALSRRHEANAKANADAARKLAEIEDSQKTEEQKLAERATAAEERALRAELGMAKLTAAATYDVPASLLDALGGQSEDEVFKAAEALSSEFNSALEERLEARVEAEIERRMAEMRGGYEPEYRGRPVESLTPGALPPSDEPVDGNDYLRRLIRRPG